MNKLVIMGNAVRDGEYKESANGTNFLTFTLAVNKRGKKDQADFFRCVEFGKGAETHKDWITKGMKCIVSGRVGLSVYTKSDGSSGSSLEVIVDELETIRQTPASLIAQGFVPVSDDDLSDLPWERKND